MRRRLVLVSMAAVFAVLLLFVVVLNVSLRAAFVDRQDRTLASIAAMDERPGRPFEDAPSPMGELLGVVPMSEAERASRYFSVLLDADGSALWARTEGIASMTAADAVGYAARAIAEGSARGNVDDYRYLVLSSESGSYATFLNVAGETQLLAFALRASSAVALAAFLLIFALVAILSERALLPFVKNVEAQRRFVTDASHELKTPITSISASADVLAAEHGDDEWVENIRSQTTRLARLVNDMVLLSRLDEAEPYPRKARFSLGEAAWETAEHFSCLAAAQGKAFDQDIEEEVYVEGSRDDVQRMISALLENALRYSTPAGDIRLRVSKQGRWGVVEVSNSCEPMDPGELPHLFDRFYRPDRSRATCTGGTGVGLSIVKAVAERHGGSVRVECPDAATIRFTVRL